MAYVTKIQKYSIHDGNGIRTTVFFKGCPLRCIWCHNPETQDFSPQLLVDAERCTGCGACMAACQSGAVRRLTDGRVATDFAMCLHDGVCTDHCLLNLREVVGKEYTVAELVREIKKDEIFYEESGGGVTLSGGEVMTQDLPYVLSLAEALHRQGISVNIDTCGFAPFENFRSIMPYTDTFLYDLKLMDPLRHEQLTGVSNGLILDNLIALNRAGAKINIRIPVIGGANSSAADMQAMIDFLLTNSIAAVQVNLLPYHNTGSSKYARMGTPYQGQAFETPAANEMERYQQLFINAGFGNTRIGG